MKYFLDTEFLDDGVRIKLISIGIVCENGLELYRENDFFIWHIDATEWLRKNVKPHLFSIQEQKKTPQEIANDVLAFFEGDDSPEIWGYFPSHDWVVFCQLFGPMINLPKPLPHRINDLKQLAKFKGVELKQENSIHNALEDARWIRDMYNVINERY